MKRQDPAQEQEEEEPVLEQDHEPQFIDFRLARPLIRAINDLKWTKPTPIQSAAIPVIMSGRDVCATAITGSGKSAAFLLPIIDKLIPFRQRPGPKALIMSPTRELALQLHETFKNLASHVGVTAATVIGGISAEEQASQLTPVPDVIIATPGRFIDSVFNSKLLTTNHLQFFVLDEADRLLGHGFEVELTKINSTLPEKHQTLLFTATLSDEVSRVCKKVQKNAAVVSINPFLEVSPNLQQVFIKIKSPERRLPTLVALVQNRCRKKTLVFLPTKALAHQFHLMFKYLGVRTGELHADLPMPERTKTVEAFQNNKIRILLASDLAARGLDIPDIEYVVNYTIPNEIERYIHRVGRTARAGNSGTAFSLYGDAPEKAVMKRVVKAADPQRVSKMVIPGELYRKALEDAQKYQDKIDAELKAEEEEKAKRQQYFAEKRMKALLDIEEEIIPEKGGKHEKVEFSDSD